MIDGSELMHIAALELVRELPLFRDMTDSAFEHVATAAASHRFPLHTRFIAEGDRPHLLHILIDGHVALVAQHNTRQATIDIIEPVATLMLPAIMLDDFCLSSAKALSEVQTIAFPAQLIRDTSGRDANFARAVCNALGQQCRRTVKTLKGEKLRTGPERLAGWLVVAHRLQGGTGNIILKFDKRTLASRLGMTPESLSRAFSHLAANGVATSGRRIILKDPDSLHEIARYNLLMDE